MARCSQTLPLIPVPMALRSSRTTTFSRGWTFSGGTAAAMWAGCAVCSVARHNLRCVGDAVGAAGAAGTSRLRPVLMTALAMIIGMLPMALGLGEGGEQNAPLGRAVIGGLVLATVATLFFVPVVFSLMHRSTGVVERTPRRAEMHPAIT